MKFIESGQDNVTPPHNTKKFSIASTTEGADAPDQGTVYELWFSVGYKGLGKNHGLKLTKTIRNAHYLAGSVEAESVVTMFVGGITANPVGPKIRSRP